MTKKSTSQDYEVGYKRPPQATQFQPGQSGNRKGRPKGSLNFDTVLVKELDKRVTIQENGVRKNVTKRAVIAMQTVNKATAGNDKAIALLLAHSRSGGQVEALEPAIERKFNQQEQIVLTGLRERILSFTPEPPVESEAATASPPITPKRTGGRRAVVQV